MASFINVRRAVKKVDRWDLNGGREVGWGGHLGGGGVRKRRELWILPGFSGSRLEDGMINPN